MYRDELEALLDGLIDTYIDEAVDHCNHIVWDYEENFDYYQIDPAHITVGAMAILGLNFVMAESVG